MHMCARTHACVCVPVCVKSLKSYVYSSLGYISTTWAGPVSWVHGIAEANLDSADQNHGRHSFNSSSWDLCCFICCFCYYVFWGNCVLLFFSIEKITREVLTLTERREWQESFSSQVGRSRRRNQPHRPHTPGDPNSWAPRGRFPGRWPTRELSYFKERWASIQVKILIQK